MRPGFGDSHVFDFACAPEAAKRHPNTLTFTDIVFPVAAWFFSAGFDLTGEIAVHAIFQKDIRTKLPCTNVYILFINELINRVGYLNSAV
jgi:hypothetical protein